MLTEEVKQELHEAFTATTKRPMDDYRDLVSQYVSDTAESDPLETIKRLEAVGRNVDLLEEDGQTMSVRIDADQKIQNAAALQPEIARLGEELQKENDKVAALVRKHRQRVALIGSKLQQYQNEVGAVHNLRKKLRTTACVELDEQQAQVMELVKQNNAAIKACRDNLSHAEAALSMWTKRLDSRHDELHRARNTSPAPSHLPQTETRYNEAKGAVRKCKENITQHKQKLAELQSTKAGLSQQIQSIDDERMLPINFRLAT